MIIICSIKLEVWLCLVPSPSSSFLEHICWSFFIVQFRIFRKFLYSVLDDFMYCFHFIHEPMKNLKVGHIWHWYHLSGPELQDHKLQLCPSAGLAKWVWTVENYLYADGPEFEPSVQCFFFVSIKEEKLNSNCAQKFCEIFLHHVNNSCVIYCSESSSIAGHILSIIKSLSSTTLKVLLLQATY